MAIIDGYSKTNMNNYAPLRNVHPSTNALFSAVGHCFTGLPNYKVTWCTFYLRKEGSPVGRLIARIYAMTGTFGSDGRPTGSPLATSEPVEMADLPTSYADIPFTFATPMLGEARKYCVDVEVLDATVLDDANHVRVGIDTSSPTHPGNYCRFADGAWAGTSTADTCFYVNGEITAGYNLTVNSLPTLPTVVPFTVDGAAATTPYGPTQLTAGAHTVVMPSTITAGALSATFMYWEDGSTDPERSIDLSSDMTLIATYGVPVRAILDSGYKFDRWELDEADVGSINPYIVLLDKGHTINAVFSELPQIRHNLTITAETGGTSDPPPKTYLIIEGLTQQVTARPSPNYRFVHWIDNGETRTENPINVLMDKDHFLTAVFEYVPPPPVTATVSGKVTDASTGAALPSVAVTTDGYGDVTDTTGHYELLDIPAKPYTLTFTKQGYKTRNVDIDVSTGGSFTQDVTLEPEEVPPTAPTIFDRAWSTFEEFSGRLNLPVPPKPAQPPKLPIEEQTKYGV